VKIFDNVCLRLHLVGILPLTINYKCQRIIAKDNDEVNKEKFSIFFICTNSLVVLRFFFLYKLFFYISLHMHTPT
jgi:hypothetical protein